jgi:heterodisulfide reductase subunit A
MPSDIFQGEEDQLVLCYANEQDGHAMRETFDLVVLSVGIMPGASNVGLADMLNINLDKHGFLASADSLDDTSTSQPGVFLAGTAQGPKDIADSMAQAGRAARKVAHHLRTIDGSNEQENFSG